MLLARRRNEEVIVTEDEITSQIDTAAVAPMNGYTFIRAVRVTTQVVSRANGRTLRMRAHDFDEFADASGNIMRRPRNP